MEINELNLRFENKITEEDLNKLKNENKQITLVHLNKNRELQSIIDEN